MSQSIIENPILKGFNPDPSIIRVGNDYYIATSTFEWFPGVQIFHSTDLVNWKLVARPLNRVSQLDMLGNPDSCGVWAPCLSYDDGTFYLVYSNARRYWSHCKDVHNYLVTTNDILGDWSEPTYLNSSGFDPSLFHDSNGNKWLVNLRWDHRQRETGLNLDPEVYFGGIVLQQYCPESKELTGPVEKIFSGSSLGRTEGPHLYQRDGYYYLLVAEGGTGYDHGALLLRSENIEGPYEADPQGHFLTSKDSDCTLQRAGHADIVECADGNTFIVHLCSRPLENKRSVMGRETAIQQVSWNKDGWLRLVSSDVTPEETIVLPDNSAIPEQLTEHFDDFDSTALSIDFQTLRIPLDESSLSLIERPGYLRLKGRESLGSSFVQALVARRQQAFRYSAATKVDFSPENFQQMAGLVCYYNSSKYYYLHITHHEDFGRVIEVTGCIGDNAAEYFTSAPINIPDHGEIYLNAEVDHGKLVFFYGTSKDNWQRIYIDLDYSILADETGNGGEHANFTGTFVGLCCQDLSGKRHAADFDSFLYVER
ncbi:glycoside hydrolase family 43 protein [Thalassotalea fonticola]|uniref:Glycoside hydrolase family 43 protein n=1 Tax=Thalassotalea fonticola TaxID=3065649 RepID=A0ABZ0GLA0_9GAMM|nr:glycoside hydrolase family 43 protein [Colwelliaceae bacterium S1-1]